MTIEIEFSIGDEVWFDSLGCAKKANVCDIRVFVLPDGYIIKEYALTRNGHYWMRNEYDIFATKDELLRNMR